MSLSSNSPFVVEVTSVGDNTYVRCSDGSLWTREDGGGFVRVVLSDEPPASSVANRARTAEEVASTPFPPSQGLVLTKADLDYAYYGLKELSLKGTIERQQRQIDQQNRQIENLQRKNKNMHVANEHLQKVNKQQRADIDAQAALISAYETSIDDRNNSLAKLRDQVCKAQAGVKSFLESRGWFRSESASVMRLVEAVGLETYGIHFEDTIDPRIAEKNNELSRLRLTNRNLGLTIQSLERRLNQLYCMAIKIYEAGYWVTLGDNSLSKDADATLWEEFRACFQIPPGTATAKGVGSPK